MPTCPTQQLFSLLSLPSSSVCHPLSEVSGDLTGSGATAHPQEAFHTLQSLVKLCLVINKRFFHLHLGWLEWSKDLRLDFMYNTIYLFINSKYSITYSIFLHSVMTPNQHIYKASVYHRNFSTYNNLKNYL